MCNSEMGSKIIDLPKIKDPRGNLTFIEEASQIPFSIKRVYWLYDVPGGEFRGSHAFKKSEEFIIAISGGFDVILNNGKEKSKYHLNRSYYGLYVPHLTWRSLHNFSTNSLCLILTSTHFDEEDYIRSFDNFQKIVEDNNE